jgi:hypothetical protein
LASLVVEEGLSAGLSVGFLSSAGGGAMLKSAVPAGSEMNAFAPDDPTEDLGFRNAENIFFRPLSDQGGRGCFPRLP